MTSTEKERNWLLLRLWRIWVTEQGQLHLGDVEQTADWLEEHYYFRDAEQLRSGRWELYSEHLGCTGMSKQWLRLWLRIEMSDPFVPTISVADSASSQWHNGMILECHLRGGHYHFMGVFPSHREDFGYAASPPIPVRLRRS